MLQKCPGYTWYVAHQKVLQLTSKIPGAKCDLYSVQCAPLGAKCDLCTSGDCLAGLSSWEGNSPLLCTLHTAHCTLHSAHYILKTAQCTQHTVQCRLLTGHYYGGSKAAWPPRKPESSTAVNWHQTCWREDQMDSGDARYINQLYV